VASERVFGERWDPVARACSGLSLRGRD
jgi:hypothetical protein